MRKYRLLLFFSILLSSQLFAQGGWNRNTLVLTPPAAEEAWTSPVQAIPLDRIEPFLSFFVTWEGSGAQLEVRFSENGGSWSDWTLLYRDPHNPDKRITQPLFTEAGYQYFQLRYRDITVSELTCHFFSPGGTPPHVAHPPVHPDWRDGECPSPPVVERSDWCPAGNCPKIANPSLTGVSHLIVHHSAGTNIANDWAAIVRAIWDLHVNGNGWSDIGYNYLIDPEGVIYTGRGNDVLGAHFCARNSNTMGVCMIGNFQQAGPKEAALSSLVQLLTWKSHDRNLDPLGSALHASSGLNLMNISGHRDGCATACPGDQLYPLLTDLRFRTVDSLAVCQGLATGLSPANPTALSPALSLLPNPAGEQIQVRIDNHLSGEVLLEIFGVDGRRKARQQFEKHHAPLTMELPLAQLPAGYYWLRLQMDGAQELASFVKQ